MYPLHIVIMWIQRTGTCLSCRSTWAVNGMQQIDFALGCSFEINIMSEDTFVDDNAVHTVLLCVLLKHEPV